jgi:hypothetical protein
LLLVLVADREPAAARGPEREPAAARGPAREPAAARGLPGGRLAGEAAALRLCVAAGPVDRAAARGFPAVSLGRPGRLALRRCGRVRGSAPSTSDGP